jgi:hypothetical protein
MESSIGSWNAPVGAALGGLCVLLGGELGLRSRGITRIRDERDLSDNPSRMSTYAPPELTGDAASF